MQVINPATGELLEELAETGADEVAATVSAARDAQRDWAALPLDERSAAVRRFRAHLQYRRDDLAALLCAETGKPITQAGAELDAVLARIDFFLDHTEATVDDEVVLLDDHQGIEEVISWEPLGVVADISAWNYPYFVGTNVIVPALLTGNAVVYKPSELASLTGRAIAEMVWGSGVPPEVFGLVLGGADAGRALLDQRLDGVFFTGSHATGRAIAQQVAGRMVHLQLELGGKDPVYVCDDVDVPVAAQSLAEGAFYNAGQSCCSVERIYVHESVHDELVEHMLKAVGALVVGDPAEPVTSIGPLTRRAQLDVLRSQVADALARGATLAAGSEPAPDGWFTPTVLTGVDHTMAVMRAESFGPIVGIQRVADDDEAVALMNDTTYGLTAGVYATDEPRATELLRRVDVGTAYWNCCDRVSPRLPWSGRNHSGMGATLSTHGIRAMVRPKAWHLRQP
jgi:acyl-CoA reductase-like NAD-dependent aldehyde dehydrogenase